MFFFYEQRYLISHLKRKFPNTILNHPHIFKYKLINHNLTFAQDVYHTYFLFECTFRMIQDRKTIKQIINPIKEFLRFAVKCYAIVIFVVTEDEQ